MWSGQVMLSQLQSKARWKVEVFGDSPSVQRQTEFPCVKLGEVVQERKVTIDPQLHPDKLLNFLGLENVESNTGDLVDFTPRYGRTIRSRCKRFYRYDVLYGRLRPYLNKVFIANGDITEGICSGEFYVLTPNMEAVLPNYLRAVLASEYVHAHVGRLQTGSALPRIQVRDLLDLDMPLPPFSVQVEYEQFLVEQITLRRRLKMRLSDLEHEIDTAFLQAIELGSLPVID